MIELKFSADLSAVHPAAVGGALAILLTLAVLRLAWPVIKTPVKMLAWSLVGRLASPLRWESEDAKETHAAGV